jgi:hypothetical protein
MEEWDLLHTQGRRKRVSRTLLFSKQWERQERGDRQSWIPGSDSLSAPAGQYGWIHDQGPTPSRMCAAHRY